MAVVRIKRHCDEEPIDSLLLACKRRKTEENHLTSVFKFTTTVSYQDDNVSKHIPKAFSSSKSKSNFKTPNITNITDRLRAENKLFSQNSRLKVINCFRALSESDSQEDCEGPSDSNRSITIVDIETLPAATSDASSDTCSQEAAEKYVYDIYYAPDCELDDKMLSNPISCHALDDLVFEDYSNETWNSEQDSDDSNDENNWRNDYPDEDPDSIGENDMKLACQMDDLNLSQANSLSSDDGEEDFVYGMDDPDYSGGNPSDVDYFGDNYAMYKKRVTNDLDSDASENSDFFYCDDSDHESDLNT